MTAKGNETMTRAPTFLKRQDKPALAYHFTKGGRTDLPPVMFLGGFRSDMDGTKATYLEEQCGARGQSYIRFDYSGHGHSEGLFENGTIGQWTGDAFDIMQACIPDQSPILIGSSMGGWIALNLAIKTPARIAGLIGLAAAPDFTEEIYGERLSAEQRNELAQTGQTLLPNDYGEPYVIRQNLIDDAKQNLFFVKNRPWLFSFPVHLIQGKKDADVPWETAQKIVNHIEGPVKVEFLEDADHRLSAPEELATINKALEDINEEIYGDNIRTKS